MNNKNLKYFIGKPCSVFTHPTNRNFKEENPQEYNQMPYVYFVGIIDEIDDKGLLMTQITTGLKSYFFFSGIIGIAEEHLLDPENQEDAKVIEVIKKSESLSEKYNNSSEEYINTEEFSSFLNSNT